MTEPDCWPWSGPGRLATLAGDPGKKLGTCTDAEDMGWKEELPPVYKTPLPWPTIPISCSLFALTGSENYLGVITTASLLPGESVAVCGVLLFQALLLKSGAQGRLPSDQRPWVMNVGLFINGVRRHCTSEAAVVTSIWKVKSDPTGTICGWKIDKEFVLRFPPFVFPRWGWLCEASRITKQALFPSLPHFYSCIFTLVALSGPILLVSRIKAVLNWKVCYHQVDLYQPV